MEVAQNWLHTTPSVTPASAWRSSEREYVARKISSPNPLHLSQRFLRRPKVWSDLYKCLCVYKITSVCACKLLQLSYLEIQNSSNRARRDVRNILNRYTLYFSFDLPENRSDISRADLLLYQLQSKTGPGYEVQDNAQYVEVNAFAKSLGIQTTAAGKYVNVSESGYQVFDITSTVKLWLSHDVKGLVRFEVVVHCYSSQTCNQKTSGLQPTQVEFFTDSTYQDKTPRLLTISNSVTENEVKKARQKRQATASGVGYCQAQQSTCCLRPLTIRFREDLGFNFVVQPTSYMANYCGGVCPRLTGGDTMTPTLYEFLSHLSTGSPGASVMPCCAGNTYLPLEVLIQYNGQLMIEELQQVIVTSCRCT